MHRGKGMGATTALAMAALCASAGATPPEVRVGGELRAFFGDDDVLHESDETLPASPAASFGERPRFALASDELSPSVVPFERALLLELAASASDDVSKLEGSAVVRFGFRRAPEKAALALEDAGSYLELGRSWGQSRLALRLFPIAGDRVRAGFLEPLAWGGETGALADSPYGRAPAVPAASVSYGSLRAQAFLSLKTAQMKVRGRSGALSERTQYGVFAGAGVRPADFAEVSLHLGYVQHGTLDQPDVRGERSSTTGAATRLVFGSSAAAPEVPGLFPSSHAEQTAVEPRASMAVEAALLFQRVKDADRLGAVRFAPAAGGALVGELQWRGLRLSAGAMLRDVMFVTRHGPGAIQPETTPASVAAGNEMLGFVAVRFGLERAFELGTDLALETPAVLIVRAENGFRSAIVDGPGRVRLLPANTAPLPELEARASVAWRASSTIAFVLWTAYRRDSNTVGYVRTPSGVEVERRSLSPDFLGYGVAARAVF